MIVIGLIMDILKLMREEVRIKVWGVESTILLGSLERVYFYSFFPPFLSIELVIEFREESQPGGGWTGVIAKQNLHFDCRDTPN